MKYKLQSFFRSFAAIAICSFSSQQLFAASTSAPGPIINIFDDLTTLSPAFGVNVFDVDTTLSADEVYLLEGNGSNHLHCGGGVGS